MFEMRSLSLLAYSIQSMSDAEQSRFRKFGPDCSLQFSISLSIDAASRFVLRFR